MPRPRDLNEGESCTVLVAYCDTKYASQLGSAGAALIPYQIPCFSAGSRGYGLLVPPARALEALQVVRKAVAWGRLSHVSVNEPSDK